MVYLGIYIVIIGKIPFPPWNQMYMDMFHGLPSILPVLNGDSKGRAAVHLLYHRSNAMDG